MKNTKGMAIQNLNRKEGKESSTPRIIPILLQQWKDNRKIHKIMQEIKAKKSAKNQTKFPSKCKDIRAGISWRLVSMESHKLQ